MQWDRGGDRRFGDVLGEIVRLLPRPFTLEALPIAASRILGRTIVLRPLPDTLGPSISGLTIRRAQVAIYYPADAPPWFALAVVAWHLTREVASRRPAEMHEDLHPGITRDPDLDYVATLLACCCEGLVPAQPPVTPERIRRDRAELLPLWSRLVAAVPEASPAPDAVRHLAGAEQLVWQQARLITEIYDAWRIVLARVAVSERALIAQRVDTAPLTHDEARAAIAEICLTVALERSEVLTDEQATQRPPMPGVTSLEAAAGLAAVRRLAGSTGVQDVIEAVLARCVTLGMRA